MCVLRMASLGAFAGRELCKSFARADYNVLCCDILPSSAGPKAEAEAAGLPGTIVHQVCDVGDPEQVAAAVAVAATTFPTIDVLVRYSGVYNTHILRISFPLIPPSQRVQDAHTPVPPDVPKVF